MLCVIDKNWHAIKTYGRSWSATQLHSNPTTTPGYGIDDVDEGEEAGDDEDESTDKN